MDEQARRAARTRAMIAFALAGVLLVINVAAGVLWREERRDRFERARIEFDQRGRGWMDDGPRFGGRSSGPGETDQEDGSVDRGPRFGPNGQGGPMSPGSRSDQDAPSRSGPSSTTEPPQEGTS